MAGGACRDPGISRAFRPDAGTQAQPAVTVRSAAPSRRQHSRAVLDRGRRLGGDWSRRARESLTIYFEKEKARHPKLALLRHGCEIFNALELGMIGSVRFNRELLRLDLPDAKWGRFRGVSGGELAHPIQLFEQAALLESVGIKAMRIRPPGEKQCRGYRVEQFREALSNETRKRGD